MHEEVPKEGTTVKTVRALKKWYGDRHLAVRHCWEPKKRTQGDGGSRKKLAAARRGMTHHAVPAPGKGYSHQGPGRDVLQGAPKGQTIGKKCRAQLECVNGIRDQNLKEQLRLREDRTSGRIFRKTAELEIAKQLVGTSTRLWKMSVRALWRGQPPPKRKKGPLITD
jgi:hypothetical protein